MPKIAIIGCGNMGQGHARRLTKNLGRTVLCASDVVPEAREAFGAAFPGVKLYDDHRKLLNEAKPEAVWVCLPTFLHKPVVLDCIAAGAHAMIEKPMALTAADCRAMDEAARKQGVKLMVAFCRRFDNHWGLLRELLVEKRVAGAPLVWRQLSGSRPPRTWFLEHDKGGGPFLDGCVHNWDFCLWAFGEAVSVKASLLKLAGFSAWDTGVADVVFASKDRTTLNWSWGVPAGAKSANGQDVLGPHGVLHFGVPEGREPAGYDAKTMGGFHLIRAKDEIEVFTFVKNDMYAEEDRHFLECIEQKKEPLCGAAAGLAATALAERVFKAAEQPGI